MTDPGTEAKKKNQYCQRSLETDIFVPSTVNCETVENADPASDFSSLIQGTKDAVLILSVRKPCRRTNVPI